MFRIYYKYLQYHTETDDLSERNAKFVQNQHLLQKIKIILKLQVVIKNRAESIQHSMKIFYQFIGVHFTILNVTHLLRLNSKIKNFVVIAIKICNYENNYCFNVFRHENPVNSSDMDINVITRDNVLT